MSRGPELPSINQLAEIAADLGLDMSLDDLTNQREAVRGAIASLRHVDDMPEERPQVKYPRTSGYRPHPDENPYNAWYWRAEIKARSRARWRAKRSTSRTWSRWPACR